MASCHAHINTFLVRLHAYYQMYSKASSSLVKVNVCTKGYLYMHLSVTLYISYLMLKERTTHVCIVQVSHAHPPLAAAVFNCYQMYSKASHK